MTDSARRREIHELDATLRVGKGGIENVADELSDQIAERDLVKVRFLRSSLGGTSVEAQAADLADLANCTVVETRGHTAVFER